MAYIVIIQSVSRVSRGRPTYKVGRKPGQTQTEGQSLVFLDVLASRHGKEGRKEGTDGGLYVVYIIIIQSVSRISRGRPTYKVGRKTGTDPTEGQSLVFLDVLASRHSLPKPPSIPQ